MITTIGGLIKINDDLHDANFNILIFLSITIDNVNHNKASIILLSTVIIINIDHNYQDYQS